LYLEHFCKIIIGVNQVKYKHISLFLATLITGGICFAQTNPIAVVEDFKPSSVNQLDKQFPQVNSEGRVRISISAPQALKVQFDIGAVKYDLKKDDKGVWTGECAPQDEGFHYYQLWVDGAAIPDPSSLYFYGASRWGSGIEIPAKDQDFYALKNVPHGQLRENHYFSKSTNAVRRCFVYTPPGYDEKTNNRYPVLYLQHGMGENETGWGNQGHTDLIMDNLIAEGKTKPFIIVMDNSSVTFPAGARPGMTPRRPGTADSASAADTSQPRRGVFGNFNFAAQFEKVLIEELIPFIDANYRTLTDQPHRAMAGLSMGGMQTRQITLAHLDKFSHIGIFSGGSISMEDVKGASGFKEKVRLVFVSFGSRELENRRPGGPFGGDPKVNSAALKDAGINSQFYVSPLTAHEWQSWRRSLHEFAPLLFKD
jgi:enterochelin esterase family protein